MSELKSIREQIDEVDAEICALLKKRMELTSQVAESKRGSGKAIRDEVREAQILLRVTELCGGEYAADIFREIMRCSREQQADILGIKD